MMRRKIFSFIIAISAALLGLAANPMATNYTYSECRGSLSPYPTDIKPLAYGDTLTPVFINHVGRHGSRFPASSTHCTNLYKALMRADSCGAITALGKDLLKLTKYVIDKSANQWGALDSLGEAEQRLIASRMIKAYPKVFNDKNVIALSSYSPRSMMSMYTFLHQLDRLNNHIEFSTTTGRANNRLLRPFDVDKEYIEFRDEDITGETYNAFYTEHCTVAAIERVLGKNFPYQSPDEKQTLALAEYYVIAGLDCMMVQCDISKYFTREEFNSLWSCFNLRQYLQWTASTISSVPAELATDLLLDLITTTDSFINGDSKASAILRFGHAETLMPLLSLMRMKGCYYMTNYFDTVAQHWRDFDIVPMAANLQIVLFKHKKGKYYACFLLNEKPIPLIPNTDRTIIPWTEAKEYLTRCLPLYAQP